MGDAEKRFQFLIFAISCGKIKFSPLYYLPLKALLSRSPLSLRVSWGCQGEDESGFKFMFTYIFSKPLPDIPVMSPYGFLGEIKISKTSQGPALLRT